ncbi:hypothetical protein [Emticicia sp. SJ17W-69]|uniref:hypothetical protein n=1 Tax=Emticicia sp. SJ17W-69 TaxID=3421657 RepID=UPI003EBB30B2
MEQEELWVRVLKRLNILPLVVCSVLLIALLGTFKEIQFILIALFGVISYSMVYFVELEEQQQVKMIWIWALNLISTTIWLIIFSKLAVMMLITIDIFPILLSVFIVGYPLYMLYYNFRLFMNEISKPELCDGFPNPSY